MKYFVGCVKKCNFAMSKTSKSRELIFVVLPLRKAHNGAFTKLIMKPIEVARNNHRISSEIIMPTVDSALGEYVDGYCSKPGTTRRWAIWCFLISLVYTIVCVAIISYGNITKEMMVWCSFGVVVTIVFLVMMIMYSDDNGSKRNPLKYYYVFTNGFMEEQRLKNGSLVSSKTVFFGDVESLDVYYINTRAGWSYYHTKEMDMKVFGKSGEVIFEIPKVDVKYVSKFASEAIVASWIAYKQELMMREYHNKGYIVFENIEMGRDRFLVDGVDYLKNARKLGLSMSFVTFIPADPMSSSYYNKLSNPSGAWKISIVNLKNKESFFTMFKEIYKDRLQ